MNIPVRSNSIYQWVSDTDDVLLMMKPLLDLKYKSREELGLRDASLRCGKYLRRCLVTFKVEHISLLRIPTKHAIRMIDQHIEVMLLYQHQAQPQMFDIYIKHKGYTTKKSLASACKQFIKNLARGEANVLMYSPAKDLANFGDLKIKQRLLQKTGFLLQHQLIEYFKDPDHPALRSKQNTLAVASNNFENLVMVGDKIFDINIFAKACLKVFVNIIFFSQNETIRALRAETNRAKQIEMLRLLDHRPLILALWHETINYVLLLEQSKELIPFFTQEQISLLFNAYKDDIVTQFNLFALGDYRLKVQPHPVRGLLDHLPFLQSNKCFELSLYNFKAYGLNVITFCFYLAKNFLTQDSHLSNNQGAVCLIGASGSGKSRTVATIFDFMNGFNFQDSPRGLTEFQNYEIVNKSFLKIEEVLLRRLITSDFKMVTDIEASVKCHVKNQPDVECTKHVPVVLTSNGNLYEDIIQHKEMDANIAAAHRRCGFIRYFESWNSAHIDIMDRFGRDMEREYARIYQNSNSNYELMNSFIGCALMFQSAHFVTVPYIIPYYTHCLTAFAGTLFGQVMMSANYIMDQLVHNITTVYSNGRDVQCLNEQEKCNKMYQARVNTYIMQNFNNDDLNSQLVDLFIENSTPFYFKCLQFTRHPGIQERLLELRPRILKQFLDHNKGLKLYDLIAEELEFEQLLCVDIIDSIHLDEPSAAPSLDNLDLADICIGGPTNQQSNDCDQQMYISSIHQGQTEMDETNQECTELDDFNQWMRVRQQISDLEIFKDNSQDEGWQ